MLISVVFVKLFVYVRLVILVEGKLWCMYCVEFYIMQYYVCDVILMSCIFRPSAHVHCSVLPHVLSVNVFMSLCLIIQVNPRETRQNWRRDGDTDTLRAATRV